MARVIDHLKGINAYPIPQRALAEIADKRGLNLEETITAGDMLEAAYQLAKADLLLWLSIAPDVAQGGQSFSFTDAQRKQLRSQADAIYHRFEEANQATAVRYGYKGSRL
ncbi:hypothetical protein EVA_15942 [gut metagenome]|uniref:Uncharacterized protein n=1 Tax=gut metagenome TaxID=749906 RepID=J9FM13_9ZZZZ